MESLKSFESLRNVTGYRLAWMPQRGEQAFWVVEAGERWSGQHVVDRSMKLKISATQYHGEKRVASQGMYVAHTIQILNRGGADDVPEYEVVRPFASNEL